MYEKRKEEKKLICVEAKQFHMISRFWRHNSMCLSEEETYVGLTLCFLA